MKLLKRSIRTLPSMIAMLLSRSKIVKELKSLHTSDSLKAIKYIIKLDSVCKIVRDHELWLEDDYKNIQVLKTRTAPKTKITTNQPYRQQLKHNIK